MHSEHRRLTPSQSSPLLCLLCASAVNVLPAFAGDLTPPPGPVAPPQAPSRASR